MILGKDGILHPLSVELSVDKLMRDNVPIFNFWAYCLLNDYLVEDFDDEHGAKGKYMPGVDGVYLIMSKDEQKNQIVTEMFDTLKITWFDIYR